MAHLLRLPEPQRDHAPGGGAAAAHRRATMFGPIVRGAAAALGKLVDRRGAPIVGPTHLLKGGVFLVRCGLL